MNNVCPNCGAVYNVTSKDVGRRIACKRCQAPLTVDETGLRLDEPSAGVEPEEPPPPEVAPRPSRRTRTGPPELFVRLTTATEFPTLLLGAGLFFTILFSIFPQIDADNVAWRRADLEAGELEDKMDERTTAAMNGGNPPAEERDKRLKRHDEWEKKEKPRLEEKVKAAEISARKSGYWNAYGRLLGYLLLSFGGLGYLAGSQQTALRRGIGAAILLIVLLVVTHAGAVVAVGGRAEGPRPGTVVLNPTRVPQATDRPPRVVGIPPLPVAPPVRPPIIRNELPPGQGPK